ncbi:MAG: glycosyltransferase family 39 protein [Lentisphaerae bacterium]|nr:glycosyltransferase family 39 protein [Lentisphaerota bacterium]
MTVSHGPARECWILIGLLVLTFALRLALLNQYVESPYFLPLGWDPRAYDLWAQAIAAGHWTDGQAFHQPPLFPFLLAGFYAVVGRDFYVIFLLQGVCGALSAMLLYVLGRDVFRDRRVGILAALGWCFHGLGAFYTLKLLSETSFILLSLVLVWALYRATARATPWRWLGAGLLLGLSVAMKPNMILFLPLAVLHRVLSGAGPRLRRWRDAVLCVAATIAVILPILLYNRSAEGEWVFISWNGGGNLYSGNNLQAQGLPEPLPGVSQDRLWRPIDERRVVGRALGVPAPRAGQIVGYWSGLARAYMREHPGSFALLLVQKLRLALSGMENFHMYWLAHERERFTPLLALFPVTFYQILPLSLVGLLATLPRWRRYLLLYGVIAVTFATLLIFYVLTRFRVPAEPFLLLFAAYALVRLWPWTGPEADMPDVMDVTDAASAVGSSRESAATPTPAAVPRARLLGLLAVFALCSAMMYAEDRDRFPGRAGIVEFNLAELLFDQGKLTEAEQAYTAATLLNPHDFYPALGVCKLLLVRHGLPAALRAYTVFYPYMNEDLRRDFLRDETLAAMWPGIERINAAMSQRAAADSRRMD